MNNKNSRIKAIFACLLCAVITASVAGCSKKDSDNSSGDSSIVSSMDNNSGGDNSGTGIGGDNGSNSGTGDPLEYTPSELYSKIGSVQDAAYRDESVYIDGEGFQHRLDRALISTEKTEGGEELYYGDIESGISKIVLGDRSYAPGDLIKDKTKGFDVLKTLVEDFGLNICDSDGTLIERKGDVSDSDGLRSMYSDRVEFDEYTVCTYYIDARMGNYDEETYVKYREAYAEKNGVEGGVALDGQLAVMLYYDTAGHDYFYTIVVRPPTYFIDEKNFMANMNANISRPDVTRCRIDTKDGLAIGLCGGVTDGSTKTAAPLMIVCTSMPG